MKFIHVSKGRTFQLNNQEYKWQGFDIKKGLKVFMAMLGVWTK